MSSPKRAAKIVAKAIVREERGKIRGQVRRQAAPRSRPPLKRTEAAGNGASADAKKLAAALERGIVDGKLDVVTAEALQELIAAACRVYTARVEAGEQFTPIAEEFDFRHRRHGHGERIVESCRSRGFRARHVAELDGPLSMIPKSGYRFSDSHAPTSVRRGIGTPGETLWISSPIAAAA